MKLDAGQTENARKRRKKLTKTSAKQESLKIYQKILKWHPGHADTLHLLGFVEHQTDNGKVAVGLISKAIEIQPESPVTTGEEIAPGSQVTLHLSLALLDGTEALSTFELVPLAVLDRVGLLDWLGGRDLFLPLMDEVALALL